MKIKNTYTLAYEACEAYFMETGQVPTIDSIKPIININSPTTISKAIKNWKLELSQSISKSQTYNHPLPQPLLDAISLIWEDALTQAHNALKDKASEIESKQTQLESEEKAINAEKERVEKLLLFAEQKHEQEINYLKSDINRLSAENTNFLEKTAYYRQVSSEHEKKNAVLAEQVNYAQDKYERLELQYEKEHQWSLRRIEEEKNNFINQTKNELKKLQADAQRYKISADFHQSKNEALLTQISNLKDENIKLEKMLIEEKMQRAEIAMTCAKIQAGIHSKPSRKGKISSNFRKTTEK